MLRFREGAAVSCCRHGGAVALELDERDCRKIREGVSMVRKDAGKRMEATGVREGVVGDRNT